MKKVLSALPLALLAQAVWATETVDLILHNARIYQGEAEPAQALVIGAGRILYVGSDSQARQWQQTQTELWDMQGALVLPGFIDAHNHVFEARAQLEPYCQLDEQANLSQQRAALQACQGDYPHGTWLQGGGHNLEALLEDDSGLTPRALLDEFFPHNPVVLMERTSHSVLANSQALALAGFTDDSADPQGGRLLRDEQGRLNGLLYDAAGDRLLELAWNAVADRPAFNLASLQAGLAELSQYGITTLGDGRLYWRRGWLETWQQLEQQGRLPVRALVRPWIYPDVPMAQQLPFLRQAYQADPERLLQVSQVKMYADGILINNSARTLAPYQFEWFPGTPYGFNYLDEASMRQWLAALAPLGYGAMIHVIGDAGARQALNALASLPAEQRQACFLTHVEMLAEEDIPRLAALGVSADFQVGEEFAADPQQGWAADYVGQAGLDRMLPIAQVAASGANLVLSSDWDVNELNPLLTLSHALRLGERGLQSPHQAIAAYTLNAAKALGLEQITGSLAVGKSADLVVLDRDITQLNPQYWPQAQVELTLLQGRVQYQR